MNTLPLFPQDDNPTLKKCSKCPENAQWHPATPEFFGRDRAKADGLYSYCKRCKAVCNKTGVKRKRTPDEKALRAEQAREHRKTDEWKSYIKTYRAQRNKEHRDKVLEQQNRGYHNNKETTNAKRRQDRKNHPEIFQVIDKVHKHKRRAQKKASGGSHTAAQLQEQLTRQKHKCYWCHGKLGKGKGAWHADHVVPLSRGGSNDISNIVCACPTCNMKRHNKLPHEWADGGRLC